MVQRKKKSWRVEEEEWHAVWDKSGQGQSRAQRRGSEKANLQETNSWFWFSLGFAFVLLLCLKRDLKLQQLRWNLYVSRKDQTQIHHLGIAPLSSSQPQSKHPLLFREIPARKKKQKKLPSQLCQVELVLTHYIFNLIIRSFACYCNIPHNIEPQD